MLEDRSRVPYNTRSQSLNVPAMTSTPRTLLVAFVIIGSALVAGCRPRDHVRPNIIFVFTDDHAPHAVGAYGGPLATLDPTPNIDRLAREGMLFRNAFVTNSICAPSRAVILTGLHSHLNGVMKIGRAHV